MSRFELLLLGVLLMGGGAAAGTLYGYAQLDGARVQTIQECRWRNDILHAARDAATGSKFKSWDHIYDQAKKAERRQP